MKIQIQKTLQGSEIVSKILWCLHASSDVFKKSASNVYIVRASDGVRVVFESGSLAGIPKECVTAIQKSLTIFGIKACVSSQIKSKGVQAACLVVNQ